MCVSVQTCSELFENVALFYLFGYVVDGASKAEAPLGMNACMHIVNAGMHIATPRIKLGVSVCL